MTLLREIQPAATEAGTPLPTVLRKCKILASRLRHEPLKQWTEWELTGYPTEDALPDYRRGFGVTVLGNFSGPFNSGLKNARIPQYSVDGEHRDWLFHVSFREGVAELEELAKAGENGLRFPWPADVVVYYAERLYEGMVMMTADRVISTSVVTGILDTVRTRVLTFALEIEEEEPDAGEEVGAVPRERVSQIFNTYIYGGQANLAAAGGDVHQSATSALPSTWLALRTELADLGVPEPELAELEAAVRADGRDVSGLGPKTEGWLGKMATRLASGAASIATGTTADVLANVLLRHLGG